MSLLYRNNTILSIIGSLGEKFWGLAKNAPGHGQQNRQRPLATLFLGKKNSSQSYAHVMLRDFTTTWEISST